MGLCQSFVTTIIHKLSRFQQSFSFFCVKITSKDTICSLPLYIELVDKWGHFWTNKKKMKQWMNMELDAILSQSYQAASFNISQ